MDAPARVKDPSLFTPLARFAGAIPPRPRWFDEAIACEPERRTIEIEGAGIETLLWGEIGKPGLLFLHGNGAHAGWWRFIAPFFAKTHRVAALSWSGMGRSDWRTRYTLDHFVAETIDVAEATGLFAGAQKPVFVGHSFGSFPLVGAADRYGERMRGVVLVDSPFSTPERREERRRARGDKPRRPNELRPHNIYPSFEAALARFRLSPLQPCDNLYIADLIARDSLKSVPLPDGRGEGWTWRFDPLLWRDFRMPDLREAIGRLHCDVVLMRGGLSELMQPRDAAYTLALMPAGSGCVEIPEARHHVMIDQPLPFVAALRAILAMWDSG
jgi:pimeloyl-ACP methyl ester carboxylesterase